MNFEIGKNIDSNDREMHNIFKGFTENKLDFKPNYLNLSEERTIALTYDNNLVYYDKDTSQLQCYGMLG